MDKWNWLLVAIAGIIIVVVVVVVVVMIALVITTSDPNPCTRRNPTAQNIVDCMKAQPTNTPEVAR